MENVLIAEHESLLAESVLERCETPGRRAGMLELRPEFRSLADGLRSTLVRVKVARNDHERWPPPHSLFTF